MSSGNFWASSISHQKLVGDYFESQAQSHYELTYPCLVPAVDQSTRGPCSHIGACGQVFNVICSLELVDLFTFKLHLNVKMLLNCRT